jgi:diguanylate cyclase (GGDEF)-like protein/PAS domain S-box-containing protein
MKASLYFKQLQLDNPVYGRFGMNKLKRYFTILDTLPDHIFIFSESGLYVDVFGGYENEAGFDCKPFIGKLLHEIAPLEMADLFLSFITKALSENTTQKVKYKFDKEEMIALPAHIPHPQEIWFEGTIKPLPMIENNERTVLWIAKNITQQHILEQRLKELSEIDELTQVFNRRSMSSILKSAIDEYHQFDRIFSFIMFDIDKFKRINDTLGHHAGDEVIRHIVNVAKSQLRTSDSLCRVGGEEFAIILRDTDAEYAVKVAEKLRIQIENSVCKFVPYEIKVTISLGVTDVNSSDINSRNIVIRADQAMYHAKVNGRNQTNRYFPSENTRDTDLSKCAWLTINSNEL